MKYLGKFAGEISRDFQVLWEFYFEVPYIRFVEEDMKEWMKKDIEGKKGKKNKKYKTPKHKKDVGYIECDLMRFVKENGQEMIEIGLEAEEDSIED